MAAQHPSEGAPPAGPYDDFPHHDAHDPLDDDLLTGGTLATIEDWQAETAAEEALTKGVEAPKGELFSFYDRLRKRVLATVERRAGKLSADAMRALLLVPDVFMLLVRLTLDKEVPGPTRAMIGGAIAYFILPIDLLPEAILGPVGYMDDLVLAVAVLAQAFSGDLEPYARKHWSGPEDLRVVLRDISTTAEHLLGRKLYDRLRRLLGRRGIDLKP